MSKRARSEASEGSMSSINIDEAFQRKKQKTSATIVSDEQNKMDDWYDSSRLSKAQRNGENIKRLKGESDEAFAKRKGDEIAKWWKRRELDSVSNFAATGMWQYNEDKLERRWIRRHRQNSDLVKRTGDLTLGEAVGGTFQTHQGDKEISSIYHKYWLNGDKQGFLDKVYEKYAEEGHIPEKKLWEIFRCLISELVPKPEAWDGIPEYIVANPHTIWQVGKCMFNILTRGRFWDNDSNTLNPVDNDEKFGKFKVKVLQKVYSRNLIKYIVGCLSAADEARFVRQTLLDHFETVLSVYEGTYVSEPEDDLADLPYEPKVKNPLIPDGLTNAEGGVYERLINIVKRRQKEGSKGYPTPHIFDITDLAKDYDDLTALLCLKELKRLGVVTIEGLIANLMPADQRALFGRGALDSLGLPNVPIARGTKGSEKPHEVLGYEFDGIDDFMPPEEKLKDIPEGQALLKEIFEKAVKEERKLTYLAISSLMDIAQFCQTEEGACLLKKGLGNVVLQGGYRMVDGILTADPEAANNGFDIKSAQIFHTFMQENKIPSTVWTKVATFATAVPTTVFEFMEATGHPLGPYLRKVQIGQDSSFYLKACSNKPFAPHMTQPWYLKNRSAWLSSGHEPDEPYPTVHELVPFFINIIAYDALAAIGSAGEDVVEEFKFVKPLTSRPDADDPLHKVVGVTPVKDPPLPTDCNFNSAPMNLVITALLKGALLSVQQGMES
ncbi:hypothetical protein V8E51_007027 [Hyaloscypha variabilis]